MDLRGIQGLKGHQVGEADLATEDQKEIMAAQDTKAPLARKETQDTTQGHLVHLDQEVFVDYPALKGNR